MSFDINKPIFVGSYTGVQDFPGRYARTLYLPGCNLSCPFCFNQDTVVNAKPIYPLTHWYKERWLEGIVLSGGEPTIHPDFNSLVYHLQNEYPLCLHTNGTTPIKHGWNFESVILSLKPAAMFTSEKALGDYINTFAKTIQSVDSHVMVNYKEIRSITGTYPMIDYIDTWDMIEEILNDNLNDDWRFSFVKEQQPK